MSEFTLYRAYIKQRRPVGSISWQTVLPMQISYTDGSGHTTVLEAQSTHCGYIPPPEPMYRWVQLPINAYYDCDEDFNRYYVEKRQVSMDNGATWNDITPSETRRGALYESQSITCGYVEPVFYKFGFDGMYSAVCDDTSAITHSDVCGFIHYIDGIYEAFPSYYKYHDEHPKTMTIGECVDTIGSIQDGSCVYGGSTFPPLYNLSAVTLGENVREIKYSAFKDTQLREIDLVDSVEKIGSYAFKNTYIKHITYPEGITDVGEDVGYGSPIEYVEYVSLPPNSIALTDTDIDIIPIFVPDSACSAYRYKFPELADVIMPTSERVRLATITTSNLSEPFVWYATYKDKPYGNLYQITDDDVKVIAGLWEHHYSTATTRPDKSSITSVEIGKDVQVIRSDAFARLNTAHTAVYRGNIESLTFEEGSVLTHIHPYAFDGAYRPVTASPPNYSVPLHFPDSLIEIGDYSFANNTSLRDIYVPSGVTTIGYNAFYAGTQSSPMPDTRNMFFEAATPSTGFNRYCFGSPVDNLRLWNIFVPSSGYEAYMAHFPEYASRIFCNDKVTITYMDSSTYTAFQDPDRSNVLFDSEKRSVLSRDVPDYTNVRSAVIPYGMTGIGNGAFGSCVNLTSVTIPDSVTTVGFSAFQSATTLTSITLPSGVTSIGDNAFNYCESLTSFTCLAETPPSLGVDAFGDNNSSSSPTLVIYVPANSVSAYKTTGRWVNYADRIQAMS